MKPYTKTKPSGVEWLGDVPENWAPVAMKRYATRYAGGTPDRNNEGYWEEGTIPWINSGAVNQRLITEPSAFITQEGYANSSARYVPKNALVMALAGQGKTKGMVAQMGIEATCNQSMAAICPRPPIKSRYLYWLLVSQYEHIRNMAGGEQRDGLNLEILGNIPCLIPSDAEQTAIAAYLDRETGRIDELVGKKQDLIERLKEKRTALISRTVTRGLPADLPPATLAKLEALAGQKLPLNPPLKPSGIDWLGDVPEHWEVKSLTRLTHSIRNGTSAIQLEDEVEAAVPVTRIESISGGVINFEKVGLVEWTPSLEAYRLNRGDILMSHINSLSMVGNCAVYDSERPLFSGMNLLRIQPEPFVNPYWLWRALSCDGIRKEISARAKPAINQASVTTNQIKSLILPVPSLPEQGAIAAYLDEETAKLDALVAKVETAIERLQEYRTALITAAVTGKIDVREEVTA